MNKAALAAKLADKLDISKKLAEDFIEAFEETVTKALMNGETVTIAGFGAFSARVRAGRMGVNPQNPAEKIEIPPVTVPKFKAGKALKDSLKGKREAGASSTPESASAPAAPAPSQTPSGTQM